MSLKLNSKTIQSINKTAKNSDVHLYSELKNADATTLKGAKSYSIGNHDPRVVLFAKSVRGLDLKDPKNSEDNEKYLEFLLEECWKVSPLDTLRLMFHIRDCRGGKGEKKIFYASCRWLMRNHPHVLRRVTGHIPHYGSWKDMLQIFSGTEHEEYMIQIYATCLKIDKKNLNTPYHNAIETGTSKFAPSENGEYDKKYHLASKFAKALGVNLAQYRKEYLRPLRSARATIVEEQMCAKEWDKINFERVPSIAAKNYKNAFKKHCPERYVKHTTDVREGKAKMNVSVLEPAQIINIYSSRNGAYALDISTEDETAEAQWAQLLKDRRQRRLNIAKRAKTAPVNALAVVDVSGSMFTCGKPRAIDVSVSMGLLVALLNDEDSPFYRKWVTFSANPVMETLKGDTLVEMIIHMDKRNWDMTTNFISVFKLILETATAFNVPQSQMPQMLIVISDMQFDYANASRNITAWEALSEMYREKGYTRPTLVFWNVAANTLDMPTPHSEIDDCVLVGGFSANLMDSLIDGNCPSPYKLMRKVIDGERYAQITLPENDPRKPVAASSSSSK